MHTHWQRLRLLRVQCGQTDPSPKSFEQNCFLSSTQWLGYFHKGLWVLNLGTYLYLLDTYDKLPSYVLCFRHFYRLCLHGLVIELALFWFGTLKLTNLPTLRNCVSVAVLPEIFVINWAFIHVDFEAFGFFWAYWLLNLVVQNTQFKAQTHLAFFLRHRDLSSTQFVPTIRNCVSTLRRAI